MNAQRKLAKYIQHICTLTESEVLNFVSTFEEDKIKKRQFIVQPNFTAQYRHFVIQGAFRAYVVDDDGNENTIAFAIEDGWITDCTSYIDQQPATMFVVALEDSITLRIAFEKEQGLKKENHKFETFFRIMAEQGLSIQRQRIISNLTMSAEERYNDFIDQYSHIVQRLPQYAIASYLRMTPEFLSKIRNNKVS
jgi:CRP-like cAMP-binding protein